jgi:hypothetical protein
MDARRYPLPPVRKICLQYDPSIVFKISCPVGELLQGQSIVGVGSMGCMVIAMLSRAVAYQSHTAASYWLDMGTEVTIG